MSSEEDEPEADQNGNRKGKLDEFMQNGELQQSPIESLFM